MSKHRAVLMSLGIACAAACTGGAETSSELPVIRLQDTFGVATLTGTPAATEQIPRTEWRFDDGGELVWQAGRGIEGLEIRDGVLVGRTTDSNSRIHVARTGGLDRIDTLYGVEIRSRVSAGSTIRIGYSSAENTDFSAQSRDEVNLFWLEVEPSDAIQTWSTSAMIRATDIPASAIRHVFVQPSGEAGSEFAIESARLIFRQEHLASIESGVSWQGFNGLYHETLVMKAPERVSFDVSLPSDPWLDLSIGSVEAAPLTFQVTAGADDEETVVMSRTVTTPERWETAPVDLSALAGRDVTLTLSLISDNEGAPGYWGSPVIRSRGGAVQSSIDDPPKGVILFVADTLRRDHLDAYGYERITAPTLSRLAAEGALFERNQSQGTWTKVSVASFLTSLYSRTHGIWSFEQRLPTSAMTIAEVYREAGYATLALSGNNFFGTRSAYHQGFEEFHEQGSLVLPEGQPNSKNARSHMDRLIPWLETHADTPFFATIHVLDPHFPYEPYRPYETLWATAESRVTYEADAERVRPLIQQSNLRRRGLANRAELAEAGIDESRFVQHQQDWYDASIRAMDAELGRLVETLEQLGLSDDVVVAFIADHGEEFLDHGRAWHSGIYGELSNVPLVLWGPGHIPAGRRVGEVVQSIDLMPTLLELSGLAVPERAQGQSLLPLLRPIELAGGSVAHAQDSWRARPAFVTNRRTSNGIADGRPVADADAVVVDGWKLVHNYDNAVVVPEWELFDHLSDPLDQVDLAAENPDVVERLGQLLDDWRAYTEAERLPSDDEAVLEMDSEELERLRSLGYIN